MKKPPSYPTLDLHGVIADEVFDLMDRFLRKEEAAGSGCVRILHGRGSGKMKEKALEYCRKTGYLPEPDRGESGFENPGSFLIYL